MNRLAATLLVLCLPALASGAEKARPRTQVTWYGQSTFVVQTPKGLVLAIDPWFQNPLAKDKDAGASCPRWTSCCSPTATRTTWARPSHWGSAPGRSW